MMHGSMNIKYVLVTPTSIAELQQIPATRWGARVNVVSITTRYGLGVPGFEPR